MSKMLFCTIILMIVVVAVTGTHGVLHLWEIKGEARRLAQKNQELEHAIATVSDAVNSIAGSNLILEKTARESLGLARRNEIVYIFAESSQASQLKGTRLDASEKTFRQPAR